MVTNVKKSFRGRTDKGEPNPIDIHVGRRIKLRRTTLGMSQEKLAALLGLTFQQVQKYERGSNRVGCSRIWDIANVLDVSVDFFFAEVDGEVAQQSPRLLGRPFKQDFPLFDRFINDDDKEELDPMMRQETIELVRAYYKISNRKVAQNLHDLVLSMSRFNLPDKDE